MVLSPVRLEPCVITGLGALSSAGAGVEALWSAALEGRSLVRRLDYPWLSAGRFRTTIGAPLPAGCEDAFTSRDLKLLDPVSRHALTATLEALESAGFAAEPHAGKSSSWTLEHLDPLRTAAIVSTGMGGLSTLEASHQHFLEKGGGQGGAWVRYGLPKLIPNAPAAEVSCRFGLQGESWAPVAACAGGTLAIAQGAQLIGSGRADVVIAGGSEAVLSTHDGLGLMGFDVLQAMSQRNDEPEAACRPFDRDRDGFLLSEGAGIVILESERHAQARGAKLLGRVLAGRAASQAHSMLQPEPTGDALERVARLALAEARVSPADVSLVSAHATSTQAGDRAEARALRTLFGGADGPPVTATKSTTGHAIAASGALETIVALRAFAEGVAPPTANLAMVDEGCELDHVAGSPRKGDYELALKLSSGFGGHDCALVLAAP